MSDASSILFKYISCYCLSSQESAWISASFYSNTSHVIVYLVGLCVVVHTFLFKYISCYCLSVWQEIIVHISYNSNTSHVIVYRTGTPCPAVQAHIQIHLMLLFIHRCNAHGGRCRLIQIHLMLLFIGQGSVFHGTAQSFKYISCYCLSIFRQHSGVISMGFKYISCYCLSHRRNRRPCSGFSFKYISCYCLSQTPECRKQIAEIFKYISCYCLSHSGLQISCCSQFKYISCYCLSDTQNAIDAAEAYSNTSHVIVYLSRL